MALFRLSLDELLPLISSGLKNQLTKDDIFSTEIEISHLKRIDKIFNKGIHYYLDPKSPEISNDSSIFFRKTTFGTELNLSAKKIVNQFEEFKLSLSAISKLADLRIDRKLPIYSISHDPQKVAFELRGVLYPKFKTDQKEFLKSMISKFAENNILVFEFVETWNKKYKANIDGFYIRPNVIVLKRQQSSFRREIFTLAHELGHYLLNEEEVEAMDVLNLANHNLSAIERWCNDFSYYFLCGPHDYTLENIIKADSTNDYHHDLIDQVSKSTHLSQIALFTRLLLKNRISQSSYNKIKSDSDEMYRRKEEEANRQKEIDKMLGKKIKAYPPKPINSPLLITTIQTAFHEGVITEYEVCKSLNLTPDKLDKILQ